MKYQYIFALALIFVIAVSGCVEGMPDVLKQMMGQEVEGEVKEAPADIITTQNTNIIPTPPIYAGSDFTVSFEVFNQDDIKEVKDIEVNLYDTGMCNEGDHTIFNTKDFLPQEVEYVEFKFKAPGNDEIGHMEAECPIRYKISYSFDATTQTDVQVISEDRLEALQRAGQTPTFTPTQSVGRGPIKIYFKFGATLPVKENSTLPVFIWVEDKGTGLYKTITEGELVLLLDQDFNIINYGDFKNEGTETIGDKTYIKLTNKDDIEMIKKKSKRLRCSFKTELESNTPEKTFYLTAKIKNYAYSLYEDLSVAIKPTLEK